MSTNKKCTLTSLSRISISLLDAYNSSFILLIAACCNYFYCSERFKFFASILFVMFTVLAWLSDSVALKVRVTLLGSTKIAYVDALTTLHLDLMRSISAYEK